MVKVEVTCQDRKMTQVPVSNEQGRERRSARGEKEEEGSGRLELNRGRRRDRETVETRRTDDLPVPEHVHLHRKGCPDIEESSRRKRIERRRYEGRRKKGRKQGQHHSFLPSARSSFLIATNRASRHRHLASSVIHADELNERVDGVEKKGRKVGMLLRGRSRKEGRSACGIDSSSSLSRPQPPFNHKSSHHEQVSRKHASPVFLESDELTISFPLSRAPVILNIDQAEVSSTVPSFPSLRLLSLPPLPSPTPLFLSISFICSEADLHPSLHFFSISSTRWFARRSRSSLPSPSSSELTSFLPSLSTSLPPSSFTSSHLQPAPEKGEDEFITKLRDMLRLALEGMRAGAEGTIKA